MTDTTGKEEKEDMTREQLDEAAEAITFVEAGLTDGANGMTRKVARVALDHLAVLIKESHGAVSHAGVKPRRARRKRLTAAMAEAGEQP